MQGSRFQTVSNTGYQTTCYSQSHSLSLRCSAPSLRPTASQLSVSDQSLFSTYSPTCCWLALTLRLLAVQHLLAGQHLLSDTSLFSTYSQAYRWLVLTLRFHAVHNLLSDRSLLINYPQTFHARILRASTVNHKATVKPSSVNHQPLLSEWLLFSTLLLSAPSLLNTYPKSTHF